MSKFTRVVTSYLNYGDAKIGPLAKEVHSSISELAEFTLSRAFLPTLHAALEAFEASLDAVIVNPKRVADKQIARDELDICMTMLAMLAMVDARGDEAKLRKTGLLIVKAPAAKAVVAPTSLTVDAGMSLGQVILTAIVIGSHRLLFESCEGIPTAETAWTVRPSTRKTITVKGLVSGRQYSWRVGITDGADTVFYSAVVTKFVA